MKEVGKILEEAREVFEERGETYGNGYDRTGDIFAAFFPNGVELRTKQEFERFIPFVWCITKMNRYAGAIEDGGHKDSAHDLINYAAIMERFTKDD